MEEHEAATDKQDQVAQRHGDGTADDRLQECGVGGDTRKQLTGARGFKEGGVQTDNVVIDVAPYIGDHLFPTHETR